MSKSNVEFTIKAGKKPAKTTSSTTQNKKRSKGEEEVNISNSILVTENINVEDLPEITSSIDA